MHFVFCVWCLDKGTAEQIVCFASFLFFHFLPPSQRWCWGGWRWILASWMFTNNSFILCLSDKCLACFWKGSFVNWVVWYYMQDTYDTDCRRDICGHVIDDNIVKICLQLLDKGDKGKNGMTREAASSALSDLVTTPSLHWPRIQSLTACIDLVTILSCLHSTRNNPCLFALTHPCLSLF